MGKEILLIIVNLMFSDLEILYARVQKLEWSYIRRVLSVTNADVRANGILKMLQVICGADGWGRASEEISRSSLH